MDTAELLLPDAVAAADLQTFIGRAQQVDPGGAIRLVAHGPVLAVYAGALHGGGGPTVLALRVLALAEPSDVDVTSATVALVERLAQMQRFSLPGPSVSPGLGIPPGPGTSIRLMLPPTTPTGASWAGMVPPRAGWSMVGMLRVEDLRQAAKAGIDAVAAGTPQVAGAAAVAKLRAGIWGQPLPGHQELPSGSAFAAEAFGFLGPAAKAAAAGAGGAQEVFDQNAHEDAITLHRAGRWWRLSASRGHVLARSATNLA